jgi:hypothetical protein
MCCSERIRHESVQYLLAYLSRGLAASAPATIGRRPARRQFSITHTRNKDGQCEHPSSRWNDKVTLTSDGSGEPSSDAGEGDAAAAYAVRRLRDGGGCRYMETAAAAGSGGGQADMSPTGGGGDERAGHARSRC